MQSTLRITVHYFCQSHMWILLLIKLILLKNNFLASNKNVKLLTWYQLEFIDYLFVELE